VVQNKSLMRGPQIYGRKFYPEGEALKFTNLNFNQTEGPPNQSSKNPRPLRLDEI
jgi:hypothetical protein